MSDTPAPAGGDLTPAAADAEINQTFADPKHAYYDDAHPGHAAAVARMTTLFGVKSQRTAAAPEQLAGMSDLERTMAVVLAEKGQLPAGAPDPRPAPDGRSPLEQAAEAMMAPVERIDTSRLDLDWSNIRDETHLAGTRELIEDMAPSAGALGMNSGHVGQFVAVSNAIERQIASGGLSDEWLQGTRAPLRERFGEAYQGEINKLTEWVREIAGDAAVGFLVTSRLGAHGDVLRVLFDLKERHAAKGGR